MLSKMNRTIIHNKAYELSSYLISWFFLTLLLVGCNENHRTRPYGYLRLGSVYDLMTAENFLQDKWLMLKFIDGGLSAMSTLCTKDLSPLQLNEKNGERVWECPLCHSSYNFNGKNIAGEAKYPLPHYALLVDSKELDMPKEELYVKVGVEVDPDWKLKIHIQE